VSLAVGMTGRSSQSDLMRITDRDADWLRFTGSYSNLRGREREVVDVLCAVRPKRKLLPIVTLVVINRTNRLVLLTFFTGCFI